MTDSQPIPSARPLVPPPGMAPLPPIGSDKFMVVWFGGGVVGSDVTDAERYDGAWEHTEQCCSPNHGDMISYSTLRFLVVGFAGVSICWVCSLEPKMLHSA